MLDAAAGETGGAHEGFQNKEEEGWDKFCAKDEYEFEAVAHQPGAFVGGRVLYLNQQGCYLVEDQIIDQVDCQEEEEVG